MANNNGRSSFDMLLAALLGAAVGAAAVLLSDKENREKLEKRLDEFKDAGEQRLEEYQGKAANYREMGRERLIQELEKLQVKLEAGKPNNEKKRLAKPNKEA